MNNTIIVQIIIAICLFALGFCIGVMINPKKRDIKDIVWELENN